MNGVIEIFGAEISVSQGDDSGKDLSPTGDLFQEGGIYFCRASFILLIRCVLVEGAFQNGILGEYPGDLILFIQIILIGQVYHAGL